MTHRLNILVREDEGAKTALLCLPHPVGWKLSKLILEDLDIWYIYDILTSQLPEGCHCRRIVFASLGPLCQTQFFCWGFYEKTSMGGPHWFLDMWVFQVSEQSIERWMRNRVHEAAILFRIQNRRVPYIMQSAVSAHYPMKYICIQAENKCAFTA